MSIVPKLKKKTTRKSPPVPLFLVEGLERSRQESAEVDAVLQRVASSPAPYERAHALHRALTKARQHSFYAHWSVGQVERVVWWLEKRYRIKPEVDVSACFEKEITAQEHYDLLHRNSAETALLWQKNKEKKWHKITAKNNKTIKKFAGDDDTYLSVNSFRGWRKESLLRELNACYVDIDKNLTRLELLQKIEKIGLPPPSFFVFSGRGWHLYWLIERESPSALKKWKRLQDALIRAFDADTAARDCTRVLRLVGTTNSKNGAKVVGTIIDKTPYSLDYLHDEVVGEVKERVQPVADLRVERVERGISEPALHRDRSIYGWWRLVYRDLCAIVEHQENGRVPEGHRVIFLHLLATALSWIADADAVESTLKARAQRYTPELDDKDVQDALKTALERAHKSKRGEKIEYRGQQVDPRYHYRRSTLYGLLRPLISDSVAPRLRAIISDEMRAQRRAEREAARDRVAEGRHKVRHSESLSALKPWQKEGISRRTWYRRNKNL